MVISGLQGPKIGKNDPLRKNNPLRCPGNCFSATQAVQRMRDFSVQGITNLAWAFAMSDRPDALLLASLARVAL